ncbi:hypothetical protein TL16_g06875 [Triparma laevis f. inornata]|uniref:Uncharacterized protein n=1 Tax=Triparma laevis f. inornata TaxID=1714386 RepID=A0A9W7AQB5_9STRA|nr:hypothetical protein TL16_g06875 [Triparma laevis f. inornata]
MSMFLPNSSYSVSKLTDGNNSINGNHGFTPPPPAAIPDFGTSIGKPFSTVTPERSYHQYNVEGGVAEGEAPRGAKRRARDTTITRVTTRSEATSIKNTLD